MKTSDTIIYDMLRREKKQVKQTLRRHAGAGIYQYGAGIYQYGAGNTPYGGASKGTGIIPYGGCSMSGTPLRRMGGAGIKDFFKKGIKAVKGLFKKNAPALTKLAADTAISAVSGLAEGKSFKDVGKSIGTTLADKAANKAISQLPEGFQPAAQMGYDKAKKKIGGTSPLRPAKGELSAAQLRYLKKRSESKPADKPPVFDRHELQMFGNIIQGKQILGSGMKM